MHARSFAPALLLLACGGNSGDPAPSRENPPASPPDGSAPPPDSSQPGPPPPTGSCTQAAFDAYLRDVTAELAASKVTGASVAIVCGDATFTAGIGKAATGGKAVDPHTRFNVGSTQKMFTAALAMRLVEEGKLTLEDPASKWVSGINTQAPYARSFTFGELLSHVSGFPAVPPDSDQATELEPFILAVGQQPLWSPPGEVFNYSNLGFELAGLMMQKAAAQPFGALVESKVFAPAGMVDARMDPAKVVSEGNFATGYTTGASVLPTDVTTPAMGPDTGAFASADDLAHFAKTLLSGGGAMLKPESIAKMTTARTPTDYPFSQYAFGVSVADRGGSPTWSHSGSNTGYAADLAIVPALRFASAILLNSDDARLPVAYDGAAKAMTGSELPPPAGDGAFDAASKAEHAGTYQSASAGAIVVQNDAAGMKITVGGKTAALTPMWRDTYTFPYAAWGGGDLEVNFWRVSGKVKYVVARAFVGTRN